MDSQINQPQIDPDILKQELNKGFTESQIYQAWFSSSGNLTMFYQLLSGMNNHSIIITTSNQKFNDDIQMAVAASLTMQQQQYPFANARQEKVPCGLMNVGNTCYFNSLLQTYYFIYDFVSQIVQLKLDQVNIQNIVDKRIANSIQLVKNLQNLFVLLIGSDRQFVDPRQVILSICDDFGRALPIGDQKDVSEFNHYFLSRIDEAINYLTDKKQKTNNSQSQQQFKQILPGQSLIQFSQNSQQNQSFISQKSQLMRQSSAITDNSIVYKLFYGKYIPQLIIKGQQNKDCQEEIFNIIQMDVNYKSIMEGMDKYMNQVLEYRNDMGEIQQVIKQFWIQQAPQILTFQIQRVEFNKEFGSFTKVNSLFQFDKEIYLDRYLLSNQKVARDIQAQNQQMREKLIKIDQDLENLKQFEGNVEIIKNLETTLSFLKLQTSTQKQNPFYVDSNDNNAAIKSISAYYQYFIKKRDTLLKEKKDTEQKISDSYNSLKKQKYVIQSILMHEGSPDSGHYFAYIYNLDLKKWYYFNDSHVHEEQEINVFKYAFGDLKNSKSAYLIQYMKEDKKQTQINQTFITSQDKNYLMDSYGQLLSQKQRDILYQDNYKLKQEIVQQEITNQREAIISLYNKYLQIAEEQSKKYQQRSYLPYLSLQSSKITSVKPLVKPVYLENFGMYLKIKSDEKFRWLLIDNAIQKVIPQSNGLFGQPGIKEDLKTQLLEEMKKLGLNKSQQIPQYQDIQQLMDEYKQDIKRQSMISYILEQYNSNNFISALQALHKYIKLAKLMQQQTFFYQIAVQLKFLIILGIICKMLYAKNINDLEVKVLKLLIAFQLQEHFQYTECNLWVQQLKNLFNILITLNASNEKQGQEVLKQFTQNGFAKDFEMCSLLDTTPQNFDQYIENFQSMYIQKPFESDIQDYLFDALITNLLKLFQTKSIQLLFDNMDKSLQELEKKLIFKIIEENPQIN